MEKIYIALVDTPGIFASIIRSVIQRPYIHVVLSLDEQMQEAYSVGRRNPYIPYFAGFEREDREKVYGAFPTAKYRVYAIECTKEQKEHITEQLHACYRNRFHYHYCIFGLPYLLLQQAFYQEAHYTCSSFIARLLAQNGLELFQKHFSLVTPADFYDYESDNILFEGYLAELIGKEANPEGALYER